MLNKHEPTLNPFLDASFIDLFVGPSGCGCALCLSRQVLREVHAPGFRRLWFYTPQLLSSCRNLTFAMPKRMSPFWEAPVLFGLDYNSPGSMLKTWTISHFCALEVMGSFIQVRMAKSGRGDTAFEAKEGHSYWTAVPWVNSWTGGRWSLTLDVFLQLLVVMACFLFDTSCNWLTLWHHLRHFCLTLESHWSFESQDWKPCHRRPAPTATVRCDCYWANWAPRARNCTASRRRTPDLQSLRVIDMDWLWLIMDWFV